MPEGRTPDPDLPRHARDYYPEGTAPRGLGVRVRTDFLPEKGLPPVEEEERTTRMIPEPKEAPLLEKDFVPSIPLEPEADLLPHPSRLAIGTKVGTAGDGRAIRITGYDEDGQMVAEVDEGEPGARGAGEQGSKGGESHDEAEPRRSLASPEPRAQSPEPKKSHKKKQPDGSGEHEA